MPDDERLATGDFKTFDAYSLHGGAMGRFRVEGKDYFYKANMTPAAARNEVTVSALAAMADVPVPATRASKLGLLKSMIQVDEGDEAILAEWTEGETLAEARQSAHGRDKLKRIADSEEGDRHMMFAYLLQIADRHTGNYMLSGDRIVSIDHEFAFERPRAAGGEDEIWRNAVSHLRWGREGRPGADMRLRRETASRLGESAKAMSEYLQSRGMTREAEGVALRGEVLRRFASGQHDNFLSFQMASNTVFGVEEP